MSGSFQTVSSCGWLRVEKQQPCLELLCLEFKWQEQDGYVLFTQAEKPSAAHQEVPTEMVSPDQARNSRHVSSPATSPETKERVEQDFHVAGTLLVMRSLRKTATVKDFCLFPRFRCKCSFLACDT